MNSGTTITKPKSSSTRRRVVKPSFPATAEFRKDTTFVHFCATDMNLVPRKLLSSLVSIAGTQKGPRFKAPVAEILEQIGYGSRDMSNFKSALNYLMTSGIQWNLLEDGKSVVGGSTLLASWQIVDGKVLEYSFSDHLLEKVLTPEVYGVYDHETLKKFTRVGGYALYDNCKRFINVQRTPWWSIELLRRILDAQSPNYDDTRRLMDKVVRPAIEEVNSVSDIEVTMVLGERINRRITQVQFKIEPKQQQTLALSVEQDPKRLELFWILSNDFGVAEEKAAAFVQNYSEDYIRDNISVVLEKQREGSVRNVAGLLVRALEKDFRKKETPEEQLKRRMAKERDAQAERLRVAQERELEQIRIRNEKAQALIAGLSEVERANLFDGFTQAHPHLFAYSGKQRDAFVATGVLDRSPMISGEILKFAAENFGTA